MKLVGDLVGLRVRELMSTPVVALEESLNLTLANWLMQARHVRHLPVTDGERQLLGLVTHKTILTARYADEGDSLVFPVSDIMVPNPVTLSAEDSAADAARFMVENQIGCAVIVDQDNRIEGILTESDFIELAARALFRVPRIAVDDFMTTDVVTLTNNEPIAIADELMRAGRFRHLPVVDSGGVLCGIVTHRDLIATRLAGASGKLVSEVASPDVWSIASGSSARNAARTLADHKFGCLPVTEDGVLIGLITEADIVALLVKLMTRAGVFRNTRMPMRLYMSSPVHCIGVDTELEEARSQMSRRSISSLGVVSDRNHLVGILTASDLARAMRDGAENDIAGDRMTRDVISVDVETPIHQAAHVAFDAGVHRVFVVEDQRLIGVLSTTDMVRAVRDMRVHTPLSELMSPIVVTVSPGEDIEASVGFLETAEMRALVVMEQGWPIGILSQRRLLEARNGGPVHVVEDAMSAKVLCLPAEMPAFRAAEQMSALDCEHVVVTEQGRPVGVVTSFDMTGLCARSDANWQKDCTSNPT